MSFVLVLILIAVVALAALRLVRHDNRAEPRSESHHEPPMA